MSETIKIETIFDDESMHVGQVYAKALLGAALAEGKLEVVVDQLQSLVRDCMDKHPTIESALANPKMNVDDKVAMLDRVFSNQMDSTLLKFLKVVARRRRLDCIRSIHQSVSKLRDEALGRLQVTVTTAQGMSEMEQAALGEQLKRILNADVTVTVKVDPSVLGGLMIRIGDTVFDGSLDGQLKQLKKITLARTESAIRERIGTLAS